MGFAGVLLVFIIILSIHGIVIRKKNRDVQIATDLSKELFHWMERFFMWKNNVSI